MKKLVIAIALIGTLASCTPEEQGTAIGAGSGAIIGGAVSHSWGGAAVGAGFGLLIGSAMGANTGEASAYALQRRYDNAYVQCMYSKGHKVPVSGHLTSTPPVYIPPPPPPHSPPTTPPPPPPPR